MRSLFSGSSPARLKGSQSRDSQDTHSNVGSNTNSNTMMEQQQRRSFTFMKYRDNNDRRSSASMRASREHARQIAMKLSNAHAQDPGLDFQPEFPSPQRQQHHQQQQQQQQESSFSAAFDFNPFGHEEPVAVAAPFTEDLFAQAPKHFQPQQQLQQPQHTSSVHRKNSQSSRTSYTSRTDSYGGGADDNTSVTSASAYDMDFLPAVQPLSSSKRPSNRGRPPRNLKAPSSEASLASSSFSNPSSSVAAATPKQSMSTFPSNSSMQSSFTSHAQQPQHQPPMMVSPPPSTMMMSGSNSAGGAAARRRMRSQMRHGSSGGSSVCGSECGASVDGGTPPASPNNNNNKRASYPSNGSVSSSNNGVGARNRVQNYAVQQSWQQQQQYSPSTSVRGGGASVCSSINGSEPDLFDSNNDGGGFTFDAFGLDASEIDREVQEAMDALATSGNVRFAAFRASTSSTNNIPPPRPQDTSGDDFAPQAWDSPPGSRRSTPTVEEDDEEEDGFVDGFRISKQSPLPLVSVKRGSQSPTTSERSSSLSSITDQNTDGIPRRNMFKEKAGFTSSAHRQRQQQNQQFNRVSPVAPPKKAWKPPPGAIKLMTPSANEPPRLQKSSQPPPPQQQQQVRRQPSNTLEDETLNYWNQQIEQVPSASSNEQAAQNHHHHHQRLPEQAPIRKSFPATRQQQQQQQSQHNQQFNTSFDSHFEANFEVHNDQEEKKDDDASEEKDNHTVTTAAMTDVVSDSPRQEHQQQPRQPQPSRGAPLKKEHLERLDIQQLQPQHQALEKPLSPQEQRKKELHELRNGTSTTSNIMGKPSTPFKSAAQLHSVQQHLSDSKKQPTPQQQRAMECNSQRSSFGSFKERLKTHVGHDNSSNHSGSHRQSSSPAQNEPSSAKSEVGVSSSFTRQKMKLASMSSGARSEVGARPLSQHQTSEVNAVMNRMRNNLNLQSENAATPQKAQSEVGSTAPSFLAVKLRKTSTPPEAEQEQQQHQQKSYGMSGPSMDADVPSERRQSPSAASPRGYQSQTQTLAQQQQRSPMSYAQKMQQQRPQAEGDYGETQFEEQPYPSYDEGTESQQQQMEKAPSPKKLTYRERRELEKQQEEEAKRQQEEAERNPNQPKRDVADLIRRRIAANKSKSPTPTSPTEDQNQNVVIGKNLLRPTGRSIDDLLKPTPSADTYSQDDAPQDEVDMDQSYQDRHHEQQQQQQPYQQQERRISPRYAAPSPRGAQESSQEQQPSPRHSVPSSTQQAPSKPKQPMVAPSASGLAALHSQLKQLKKQNSQEEAFSSEQPRDEVHEPQQQEEKAAPRRVQAMVAGKNPNLDVEIPQSHSQASETNSSPSRTPKATYAMLNAFLHGRENINGEEEKPKPTEEEDGGEMEEDDGDVASPPKSPNRMVNDGRPALKDDPKYSRYFNMLKIGLPMEVVKHAMQRDGLDPAAMDGDHNKPACVGIPLKDDPKYNKYFKMLKIGMPLEAVKHSMERDGLDSHVMDQDHNMPADPSKGKKDEAPKEKDSHRRARLHWKPLDNGKVHRNSLWAKINEDPEMEQIEIDEAEFAELFQSEIQSNDEPKVAKKKGSPKKGAAVRVIDPKRANNGGIILARLKMSHDDMADVVDRIDENCMTAEQIEHIIEFLPTREERRALESYMLEGGQDAAEKFDGLCECEKFMVSMMTVKHAKRKVRALLFKLQFESCLEALYSETHTVETSCDELSNSIRLRQLLGIVLTFGNRLNTAGKGGKKKKAGAFTLDSLLKLNQAKAFDKKTTFLQYIVLIVQRNNELLLRFKDDLPTVLKADKVFWDQCISDLEEVENQLENVRRIALYQARQGAKFRVKKKKHHHEGEDDEESLSDLSLSLEEEVEALRSTPIGLFTLSAIKKVSFLRDRVEGTKAKYKKLLEYFGEDNGHLQPHELFNIIVKFCRDFDKAKEQVYADEKKKKREERKRNNANGLAPNEKTPPQGRPPTRQSSPGMLKASNMQPNASRVISDLRQRQSNNTASRGDDPSRDHENPRQERSPPPQQYAQQSQEPRSQASHYSHQNAQRSQYEQGSGSTPQHGSSNPSPRQVQSTPNTRAGPGSTPQHGPSNRSPRQTQSTPNNRAESGSTPQHGPSNPRQGSGSAPQYQGQNAAHVPILPSNTSQNVSPTTQEQQYSGNDSLNLSVSSEQSKTELRRKARLRTANRRRSVSPTDSETPENATYHQSSPQNAATSSSFPKYNGEQNHGRRALDPPIGENNNVNNTLVDNQPPDLSQQGSSSNLMRSKLRNKRLLERKQRMMGTN